MQQGPPGPLPPPAPGVAPPPHAGYQPYAGYAPPPARPFRRRANRRAALIIGGIGAVVLVVALIGWALTTLPPSGGGRQARQTTPAVPSTSAVPTGVRAAGGYDFTQHAARTDTDCAANAYGDVAEFFATNPCTRLDRALYGTTVDGRLVVASVSVVHMPDDAKATELRRLADTSGTGNVNDLLRAGVRIPGGPESLSSAGYASMHDGAVVVIAEADFADPEVRDGDLLDRVSKAALELRA